jgi:Ulp1 family protease
MYKQNPKSPVLKALKGNQGKLPQHLQEAIKAAPESPAKQIVGPKPKKKIIPGEELTGKKPKANKTFKKEPLGPYKPAPKSPAKQTTAGEFAHKKSLKEKEMGKSTKVVDKFTSALEAPFSDKTYSELKKEKRAKQKAKYNAKSPAKNYKKGYYGV